MDAVLEQLVDEVAELTGSARPDLLASDAPVLRVDEHAPFYLVGLIGGKEVGKTALVNALAGRQLSAPTGFGRGTEIAIAYAHADQAKAVSDLLEREAPGRFRIVTHDLPHLRRQVLLDLPDIDSRYVEHVELTRGMLRHMLFPVWIQSVEKYADQQPQKLLAAVAQGNDPSNFLFCLNKNDQLQPDAADEIRRDYASRIKRLLKLDRDPEIFLISALQPAGYELPRLADKLGRERSTDDVHQSVQLASRQQERSLLGWLDNQKLPERAKMLHRLLDEAQALVAARIAEPIVDQTIQRILSDPGHRLAITDEVLARRIARWPLVNLVHTLLSPLLGVYRVSAAPGAISPSSLVRTYLRDSRSISDQIQSTFSMLHRSHPLVAELYRHRKLWEQPQADAAEEQLAAQLADAVERQRGQALDILVRRRAFLAPVRWLLTIGALLWFPFVQPVLEIFLQKGAFPVARDAALLIVQLLSAAYMLRSAGFLAIWFLVLWLYVRWNTSRRVTRLLTNWRTTGGADANVNLTTTTLQWTDELLDPIRQSHERIDALVEKAKTFRKPSTTAA
ncbi:MAG TPA: hypothetical protein VF669_04385 [Tepidisphaeraceae bacterium]